MIKFEDVFFQYSSSKKTALSNINLAIKEGRWLSVLGKNGSGKSTLNKEYSKEIYDDIKNKIAIVFQNPDNQFVGSTVEEDIAFGLENRNVPQEKMDEIIDRVLEIVDMTDYRKYEPSSLSGGQKQRVAIASSLALDPEILILDEATSMLDPEAKKSILEYIKKINKEKGITIISITHDAEESVYSDDIVILESGEIVYQGNYTTLYADTEILEKYSLEVPFVERIKKDLNNYLNQEIFEIEEDEGSVVRKICKLV